MKITLLFIANIAARIFYPHFFLLAPFFLIYFLKHHKHFFPTLILGAFLDDWLTVKPLGFTLFVVSSTFLFLLLLNRLINAEKVFGALLFLFVLLLVYSVATGWLFQNTDVNYLTYVFLLNFLYGAVVLVIDKIIT